MGTFPLLRNARHRTMITPVNPLRLGLTGSFILARVTGQFIVRLKLFSNGYCPLEFKSTCSMQTHCFKKTSNLIRI